MTFLGKFFGFLDRGNVVNLSVAFVVGRVFSTVLMSLVKDVVTPLIGLLSKKENFDAQFHVLRGADLGKFNTPEQATEAGQTVLLYGRFIDNLITFGITIFVVFFVVMVFEIARAKKLGAECPFCRERVHVHATKCKYCTSTLFKMPSKPRKEQTTQPMDRGRKNPGRVVIPFPKELDEDVRGSNSQHPAR